MQLPPAAKLAVAVFLNPHKSQLMLPSATLGNTSSMLSASVTKLGSSGQVIVYPPSGCGDKIKGNLYILSIIPPLAGSFGDCSFLNVEMLHIHLYVSISATPGPTITRSH